MKREVRNHYDVKEQPLVNVIYRRQGVNTFIHL